jgi:hypothetical protein
LPTETRFVNASSWDLGLHYMTAAEGFWEASSVARKPWYSVLAVEDTLRWVPFKLNSDDSNLVQYCK